MSGSQPLDNLPRPWQIVAKELIAETNLQNILALSIELTRSLDELRKAGKEARA